MQNTPNNTSLEYTNRKSNRPTFYILLAILICVVAFSYVFFQYQVSSPLLQDGGVSLQIDTGMSVQEIANKAKEVGVVRSSFFLYTILTYSYDPTAIYAGVYTISEPLSVFEVAKKLAIHDIDVALLSITIPEGVTKKTIATIVSSKVANFNTALFLELTTDKEGYLFPDTYYISPDFTAEDLVAVLTKTYAEKIAPLSTEIASSSFTESEVITLASLLEREAKDETSMKMVSGILQNRLTLNMPLQTDASIEYALDKTLQELRPEDLEIDSPYNTYLYKGLTPTPIGNPGLQAIMAVLLPTPSDYLFYITADDGTFYYAKTFEEHKRNIAKYLK